VNYGLRAAGSDGATTGVLKIWPQPDGSGKFHNRTIDTDRKFSQTYGYFEMRAKLPKGVGPWPAFWIFNHIGTRRPEIDIMEAYPGAPPPPASYWSNASHEAEAYGVTAWRDASAQLGFYQIDKEINLSKTFNVYAVKWESSRITYYFNGEQVYSINAKMRDPMYILLSLWFGSASGEPSTNPAITPVGEGNSYEIDYVRVWKLPGY
jgi:beta-glucanase (GH16 family)